MAKARITRSGVHYGFATKNMIADVIEVKEEEKKLGYQLLRIGSIQAWFPLSDFEIIVEKTKEEIPA